MGLSLAAAVLLVLVAGEVLAPRWKQSIAFLLTADFNRNVYGAFTAKYSDAVSICPKVTEVLLKSLKSELSISAIPFKD